MSDDDTRSGQRSSPATGWYQDPEDAGSLRWWSGERWTDRRKPAPDPDHPDEHAAALGRSRRTLASPWLRLGAFVLDLLLVWLAMFLAYLPAMLLVGLGGERAALLSLPFALAALAILFVYPILATGWLGQTYGKHLLRITVVDEQHGRPIGGLRALGRTIVQSIGLYALGLGVLWVLWDGRRQAWHDKAVHSVVVIDPRRAGDNPWRHLRRLWAARKASAR